VLVVSNNDDVKRKRDGTFQKGSTANRRGRPPGAKNLYTIVREVLDEMMPANKGGRRTKVSAKEAVVRSLLVKALTPPGDRQAMLNVLDLLVRSEEAALKNREPDYPFTEADVEVIGEIYARMKSSQDPKKP
jgi:hypothetical protein